MNLGFGVIGDLFVLVVLGDLGIASDLLVLSVSLVKCVGVDCCLFGFSIGGTCWVSFVCF